MSFNNGNEHRKLNAKWEHLRVQYHEAGMSEEAIQAMYEFDLGVLNSERAYITNTLTVSDTTDDSTATENSDFKQYEKAITVTDTSVHCAASTRSIFTASGRTTPQSCADGKSMFSPSTPLTTASAEKTHFR